MRYNLTENFLLFIADFFDTNKKFFSIRAALAMAGDPILGKNRRLIEKYINQKRGQRKLYCAMQALKRRGYLAEKIFNNSRGYILTSKAKARIFKIKSKNIKRKKLPKGQWLMVFFDIPETRRRDRNFLRSVLINLGFEQLQKSVWISPFDTQELLRDFIRDNNLGQFVKLLLVSALDINKNNY